ncbi:HERV-H LTR-associating protein 1 [Choloepus didactylus]|uniref:HERV-H LTR-associating protein 1 n=1 Tax=Choloepus didactylus TaxID=27675 RepID=UPI0018A0B3BF|nr:HERV-H LTR-associating protein 1 [Choloepus didactylus]
MPGFVSPGPPVRLCLLLVCLLALGNAVSGNKEVKKEKDRAFLAATVSGLRGKGRKEKGVAFHATTKLPARLVDLSTLNLTELVNGMLSRALKDSKKFFSLLSITSYSSSAFHKFSVAIYNISSLKSVDSAKFPTRYCYCLNDRTNDLSDFTALLVDIIGNSTSYLTEIFKSTSILSVTQTNESDCIFICVMTGKSGRNLSDFWEMVEKSPVINYTYTSNMSSVLGESPRGTAVTSQPVTASQTRPPSTSTSLRAQSWGAPAPRTSPWTGPTPSSAGEQPLGTDRLPQPHPRTTGTRGYTATTPPPWVSAVLRKNQDGQACQCHVDRHSECAVTRRVSSAPRVTASRQAPASTRPLSWAQTVSERKPGGPPWGSPSSATTSSEAKTATDTRNLPGSPVRTVSTPGSPAQPSPTSGTYTPGTQTPRPTKAPAPKYPQTDDLPAAWPFAPREEPALVPGLHLSSRCPQPLLHEGAMPAPPLILALQKLNPCLMELCRFFQQCLCVSQQRNPRALAMRYCLEYYSWFLKNATYICQRVKKVSHSHTLKQKCLESICKSV